METDELKVQIAICERCMQTKLCYGVYYKSTKYTAIPICGDCLLNIDFKISVCPVCKRYKQHFDDMTLCHICTLGEEIGKIRQKYNVCPQCSKWKTVISGTCKKCFTNRQRRRFGFKREQILSALTAKKYTCQQIANEYGVSKQRVQQIFKKEIGGSYKKYKVVVTKNTKKGLTRKKLVSVAQYAKDNNVSRVTVYEFIKKGKLTLYEGGLDPEEKLTGLHKYKGKRQRMKR